MTFASTRSLRSALVCSTIALCVSSATVAAQEPKPFEAYSRSAQSIRDSVVQMARAQIGKKYRTGGQSPKYGFDCSGLIAYVMSALNVQVPRTARLQANQGLAVNKDTALLLPGDVLTFAKKNQKDVSHVGIYVGNGRFIHASSVAGKVIESPIDRPPSPLIKPWRGARRIVAAEDSLPDLPALAVIGLAPVKANN